MLLFKTRKQLTRHVQNKFSAVIKKTVVDKSDGVFFIIFETTQDSMDAFNYLIDRGLPKNLRKYSLCSFEKEPAVGFEK